jgi:hypothetical protein
MLIQAVGTPGYSDALAEWYGAPEPSTVGEVVAILTSDPTLAALFLGAVGAVAAIPLLLLDQFIRAGVGHIVPKAMIASGLVGLALFGGGCLAMLPQVTMAQGVSAAMATIAAYGTAVGLEGKAIPQMPKFGIAARRG